MSKAETKPEARKRDHSLDISQLRPYILDMTRREEKKLKSAPVQHMKLRADGSIIEYNPGTGGVFIGDEVETNALLEATGFEKIAIRVNLLSRVKYIEAKNTPVYMSPASETYWCR